MPPASEPSDRPDPSDGPPSPRPGPRPRPRHPGPAPSDLDVLARHPSLRDLAGRGWELDALPTTSVALAFAVALLTSTVAFGPWASLPLITALLVPLMLAGFALATHETGAAKACLQVARGLLIAWALLDVLYL